MLPDDGFIRWLLWAWERLLRMHGGTEAFRRRYLVTPTALDFPVDLDLEGEDLADDYFLFVKEHAGLQGWPLVLAPADEPRDGECEPAEELTGDGPEPDELELAIPYELELLRDPVRFVAHAARGVAHHVVTVDGEVQDEELDSLVDATTVFLGFGLFTANAAARSSSPGPGWMGELAQRPVVALSEHEVAYALALFAVLTEIPDSRVEEHLRPNPREFYRKAVRHVLRYRGRELTRLRQVPLAGIGPYR